MGTRWESVFVRCTDNQLTQIAAEANALLPCVFRERLSIVAFPVSGTADLHSLECTGFRAGRVALRGVLPAAVSKALDELPAATRTGAQLNAEIALAVIASRVVGSAAWLQYSEGSGQSAGAWFSGSALDRSYYADNVSEPDFHRAFPSAAQEFLPGIQYVDDELFEAVYEGSAAQTLVVGG